MFLTTRLNNLFSTALFCTERLISNKQHTKSFISCLRWVDICCSSGLVGIGWVALASWKTFWNHYWRETNMTFYYANGFISSIRWLGSRYYYSKKRSCDQKTLNLVFFSIRKRCIAGRMRLISTDMVVVVLVLLMILLAMTNIIL